MLKSYRSADTWDMRATPRVHLQTPHSPDAHARSVDFPRGVLSAARGGTPPRAPPTTRPPATAPTATTAADATAWAGFSRPPPLRDHTGVVPRDPRRLTRWQVAACPSPRRLDALPEGPGLPANKAKPYLHASGSRPRHAIPRRVPHLPGGGLAATPTASAIQVGRPLRCAAPTPTSCLCSSPLGVCRN
jgi:hypothetical protein